MNRAFAITAVLLLAAAAAAGQSSHAPDPDAASADPNGTFARLRDQWARNLHEKRLEDSVAEFAAEAEFIGPDGSRVRGTAALRQLFEGITKFFDSDLTFYSWQVEVSGDLAYDSGTYREALVLRATGEHQHSSGSYLTTYRRDKSGRWLITEQVWTGAVAADGAAGAGLDAHPVVALTFDDLPAAGSLPPGENRTKIATKLASELVANHLQGTYGFVNGAKLENDPDAVQSLGVWIGAGMNIGSHTWSHPGLTSEEVFKPLGTREYIADIAKNEPALAQYAGARDWHWFRYPFLQEGDTLEKRHEVRAYLRDHGYRVAQVSLDFEDYAWNDAYGRCVAKKDDASISWLKQTYLETATEYIKLGREEQQIAFGHEIPNIVLLHATAFTTLMLPDLLDLLRKQGFTFVALPQVEQDPAYSQDPDAALKYGGTLPDQFMDSLHLKYPAFAPKPFEKMKTLCQ